VKHEDLSRKPVEEFQKLFDRLGVEFTEKDQSAVMEYSNSSNPSEAPAGMMHQLKRDSLSNVKNWQSRLSKAEIERIREGVKDISPLFYDDEDWE
jgi:hypothetical protein